MRNKRDDKFLIMLKSLIKRLTLVLVVLVLLTTFVIRPIHVEGLSMYPTLDDQEYGFSNIVGLNLSEIKRFDVVIIYVESMRKHIVKRVIGLPGDTIEYRYDVLYVNGEIVEEPFLNTDYVNNWKKTNTLFFTQNFGPVVLDDDAYFTLGDNRPNSMDSRHYGSFNKKSIKSRNVVILYPFQNIRYEGR